MKRISFLSLIFMFTTFFTVQASDMKEIFSKSLGDLGVVKGDTRICALTNAAYVNPHIIDILQAETGCSMGKGNLLFYHCPSTCPLKVALFRRDTRAAVVITTRADDTREQVQLNLSMLNARNAASWKEIQRGLGNDAVTLVSILNAWADGAPWDYLKCAEFHNHSCAGICSGYLLVKYIQHHYPLSGTESYSYIAAPRWCKEDALQVLLDLTPGKRRMKTMDLTDQQQKLLPSANVAGILITRQDINGPGTARILTFDWSLVKRGGTKSAPGGMKSNPLSWTDSPEKYVQTVFEREISAAEIDSINQAGTNPYEVLGYKKTGN